MRRWVRIVACSLLTLLLGLVTRSVAADAAGAASAAKSPALRPGLPFELRDRPVLGSDAAGIVVVEVASFKCLHCRAFHENVFPALRERYINSGKIQWFVLNASDDPSDQFAKIFALARCVSRQGKYWEMLDSLFELAHRPPSFLEDMIVKSPKIDSGELDVCLRDRSTRTAVAGDFAQYLKLKLKGTPSFLVWKFSADGQRTETIISGAETLTYFQRVFDELLKTP